jgi:YidC/Oxa1 family membrane protein insertase
MILCVNEGGNTYFMFNNALFLLTHQIAREQSAIIRPISIFLGYIMDFLFNIVYRLTAPHSLGIAIILLTIISRLVMLPLAFKSQKSMMAMQKIQPEIEKIKTKYGDNKDPEVQQKMNREIQGLYSKHKVNPLGGCLPMLVQMPIFFALNYMMQQSYIFVRRLGDIYYRLADAILEVPYRFNHLVDIVMPKVPERLMPFDMSDPSSLVQALNRFNAYDWSTFLSRIPPEYVGSIQEILYQKESIEFFMGINLKEVSGWAFPGIIIPLMAGLTTFISSWLMQKQQKATTQQNKTMQMMMTYGMPIFIGFTTINFPAGVGLYWAVSHVFQIFQQLYVQRSAEKKSDNVKSDDVIEVSDKEVGRSLWTRLKEWVKP